MVLRLFSAAFRLLDAFLSELGARGDFTWEHFVLVPFWRVNGQTTTELERLVGLRHRATRRDVGGDRIPASGPADIGVAHGHLTGQTHQGDFVGLQLIAGRREDGQDRRREGRVTDNELGSLSEYHSDSVCIHSRTKTSSLSLLRGQELKHPIQTELHSLYKHHRLF